ncbi:MAG TPA: LysR family transcriptional regulator, partial [Methylophaga sp.]|nr:LysR family transcriptional regulator [Methylophaga sp.]
MNLHLLRIFYAVTENQNFSRAAEALFISQPAVSKGVRELEHQLG